MIKEALEYLFNKGQASMQISELHGMTYTNFEMKPIRSPQQCHPNHKTVVGLRGLVDFIENDDIIPTPDVSRLHVVSPTHVDLITSIDPGNFNERFRYAEAQALVERYEFEKWQEQDDFILSLLSQFVQNDQSDHLRKMISKLSVESEFKFEDNGSSQQVSYRAGITVMDTFKVENPFALRPYSTFLEVDQPEIACVCRVGKTSDGGIPHIKLTVADGGMWKLKAVENIKGWLKTHCEVPVF